MLLELARLLARQEFPKTLQLVFSIARKLACWAVLPTWLTWSDREKVAGAVVLDMVGYACHTAGCQRYPEWVA
ncbi:MAG: hypothetical protein HC925_07590 [Coleofasciculaceae cyanobacterium SM2_3_26]|nr:hypothetical protein [Coleofasciculaceae cyanobacterium SM2_3_26]